jgi:hypothetical protein
MKTAMTSAFVFTAALALAGAASARSVPSSHGSDKPVAASEGEKKAKPPADGKEKHDCKHDKNHPCKGSDAKSGHTK